MNFKKLQEWQFQKFQEWHDPHVSRAFRYGNRYKLRNNEHPCLRTVEFPEWDNDNITENRSRFKLFHLSWMLTTGNELPPHSEGEVCHRCVDVNLRKKSRRKTGAPCFEGTHLVFRSHSVNMEMITCHWCIAAFQRWNKMNAAVRTTGTIYFSDVITMYPFAWHCFHEPQCFGNYGKLD